MRGGTLQNRVRVVLKKRGKNYYLHFYNPDSERRRLSVGTDYGVALKLQSRFAQWLSEGLDPQREMERASQAKNRSTISLGQFFDIFYRLYREASAGQRMNYHTYKRNLERFPALHDCPIGEVSKNLVNQYLHLRMNQDGVKPATARHDIDFIYTMLERAVEWDYLERNPIFKIRKPSVSENRHVSNSLEDMRRLLDALQSPLKEIAEFAIYTGFRKMNILELRIEQVKIFDVSQRADYAGQVSMIVKGGSRKKFALNQPAVDVFLKMKGTREFGYVFINQRSGTCYTKNGLNAFSKAVRRIDLRVEDGSNFRFHDLRHVFGNTLNELGARREVIRDAYGHTDIRTSDRYVEDNLKAVGEVFKLMPRVK